MAKQNIRWLITHQPQHLFIRAARCFEQKLEEKLPGRFELELYTSVHEMLAKLPNEFSQEEKELIGKELPELKGLEEGLEAGNGRDPNYKGRKEKWTRVFKALNDGRIHMSQAQVNIIGAHVETQIRVLDMPFLFKDHDHVTRTVEGPVGQKISHKIQETSGMKALAYTYSGGFRIVGSTKNIESLQDLRNNPNFLTTTHVSGKMFSLVGAESTLRHTVTDSDIQRMNVEGGAVETTLIRFTGKHALKTHHSMFMTTILVGESFWNSLSETEQQLFVEAGLETSRQEREWSLEDAAKIEEEAVERGLTIMDISEDEREELRRAAAECYNPEYLKTVGLDPELVAQAQQS